jgi:hypothetical protein
MLPSMVLTHLKAGFLAVPIVNSIRLTFRRDRAMLHPMGDLLKLIWWAVIGLFRSRASLEAETLTLHHQLNVLQPTRSPITSISLPTARRLAALLAGITSVEACC